MLTKAKAIEMEDDHLFQLNYSITLLNNDDPGRAAQHYADFERIFSKMDDEARNSDPEVMEQRNAVHQTLRELGHNIEQLQSTAPAKEASDVPVPPPLAPGGAHDDDDD